MHRIHFSPSRYCPCRYQNVEDTVEHFPLARAFTRYSHYQTLRTQLVDVIALSVCLTSRH
ncbi:hypothetical protein E2C01_055514 [Portunus trituberculatus]|uniref:Uncharacterized protein n=1 Tax=Portunus trituberculatus TaxID=210409 RepID=A0A5B7GRE9_PORTR|nr:hypothetical protein [Portunus trituberculatus]